MKIWDPRRGNPQSHIGSFPQDQCVLGMSLSNHTLVVSAANRAVSSYDVRNMSAPFDRRVISLKLPITSMTIMPKEEGEFNTILIPNFCQLIIVLLRLADSFQASLLALPRDALASSTSTNLQRLSKNSTPSNVIGKPYLKAT